MLRAVRNSAPKLDPDAYVYRRLEKIIKQALTVAARAYNQ